MLAYRWSLLLRSGRTEQQMLWHLDLKHMQDADAGRFTGMHPAERCQKEYHMRHAENLHRNIVRDEKQAGTKVQGCKDTGACRVMLINECL